MQNDVLKVFLKKLGQHIPGLKRVQMYQTIIACQIPTFSTVSIFPTLMSSREISTGLAAPSVVEDVACDDASLSKR